MGTRKYFDNGFQTVARKPFSSYKSKKTKQPNAIAKLNALSKTKLSPTIKSYVKKAIDAEVEDKQAFRNIFDEDAIQGSGFDSSILAKGLVSGSLLPTIPQGSDVSDRIGNVIKPKSLVCRYILVANPLQQGGGGTHPNTLNYNNHAGRDFYVRVVIYNRKDNMQSATNSNIIDEGASTTNLIDIEDLFSPYNKDVFNILYSKTIRMATNRWETWDTTGNLTNAGSFFSTTGSALSSYVGKANIKLPARIRFDDATSTASNFNCFMAVGCVNADNTVIGNAEYRADITAKTYFTYQDA